jgi:hypothetical protein
MTRRRNFATFATICILVLFAAATGHAQISVLSYGAKCDGVTNDNSAFASAASAAFGSAPGNALLVPATGHPCIITSWNLTNNFGLQGGSQASIHIIGESGATGQQSTIQCDATSSDSGACIDLSGSDFATIEGLRILGGTSGSNTPRTTILLARTTTDEGFSNGFFFRNVDLENYGQFVLYSYGGEIIHCTDCRLIYDGPHSSFGEATIMLSNSNTRGMSSAFTTLKSGLVSMTQVFFDEGSQIGCFNLTGSCVELDNAGCCISNITVSGYANLGSDATSGRSFMADLFSTEELHDIRFSFLRVEGNNAKNSLAVFRSSSVKGFEVDATTFASATAPTVPEITFSNASGSVGEGSSINLQPGDTQLTYPGGTSPSTVISCAGAVWGLVIYDRNKYGAGNTPNACPGAIEVPGGAAGTNWSVNGSGDFNIPGNLTIGGTIRKGGGSFMIDHPLDPAHKYLSHSFVESPDMMNVYNGNITTNKRGLAVVVLPEYFEALNRDFRYQLTAIGQFAQVIVAKEINGNHFTIRTTRPGVRVSWQVTGIRHDAFADAHRIPTEEMKPPAEQGHYLHPELFGARPEQAVGYRSPKPSLQGDRPQIAAAEKPSD